MLCQICGKPNHSALECWHRLDSTFQASLPSSSVSRPHPRAYAAFSSTNAVHNSLTDAPDSSTWFLDSTATNHFTNDLNNLNTYQPYLGPDQVTMGDGSTLPIHHTGNGILSTPTMPFTFNKLFHVLSIASNLLSVHQLIADNKCTITFDVDSFVIQDKLTKKVLYKGGYSHGL